MDMISYPDHINISVLANVMSVKLVPGIKQSYIDELRQW